MQTKLANKLLNQSRLPAGLEQAQGGLGHRPAVPDEELYGGAGLFMFR